MIEKPITLLVIGRSACGKGTQAKLLVKHFGIELPIVTGDLFRKLSEVDSFAGRKVTDTLNRGGLFPDWLAVSVWGQELIQRVKSGEEDIVFDGLGRRLSEVEMLDRAMKWFDRSVVPILLEITDEEATHRMELRGRHDDTPENIRERLEWYRIDVVKSLEYYGDRLIRVDGMPPPDQVFQNILHALGEK